MTCRLILMRHAKSDWSDGAATDHERLLNRRGQDACDAIGRWLAARGYAPEQVLCSDAARTRETWTRLASHLRGAILPELRPELYLAEASAMLRVLRGARAPVVAMIGHNPGIGGLAGGLCAQRPAHPRFGAYPTLATLVVDFDVAGWAEVQPATGRVADFIVPRDLTD